MKKMKMPSQLAILFNGAAILIGGASLVVVLRSVLVAEDAAPCAERYPSATRLSLDRNGEPLTASDLQARIGNSDWGLLAGAKVVKLRSGPSKHALEMDLASAPPASPKPPGDLKPGLGFNWTPQGMGRPKAACLTYSVFLPEGFTFGRGGRLPGLVGMPGLASEGAEPQFSTRYTWGVRGEADIHAQLQDWPEGRPLGNDRGGFTLEPGKWISLEQEVILNAPGKNDGVIRVWRDGRLAFQKSDVSIRAKPSVLISGVIAEAVAGEQPSGTKVGPQKIWMTPFELRWQ